MRIFILISILIIQLQSKIFEDLIAQFEQKIYEKDQNLNMDPIVGIVVYRSNLQNASAIFPGYAFNSINTQYVKFVQQSAARIIPIQWDHSKEKLKELFSQINGLFIPGGGNKLFLQKGNRKVLTPLGYQMKYMVKLAIEKNKNGTHFPIFGICLGMQALAMFSDDSINLRRYMSDFRSLHKIKLHNVQQSELWKNLQPNLRHYVQTYNVSQFNHKFAIPIIKYKLHLEKDWLLTSTSVSKNGLEFVSSIESRNYPIWGFQFHPENTSYLWGKFRPVSHSLSSVMISQYFSNFYVQQCRMNHQTFTNILKLQRSLIENFESKKSFEDSPRAFFIPRGETW